MTNSDGRGLPQPQTFAQKALARAAGLAHVEVGQVVDARPDVVLSHDNTAAIRRIWQEFGQERVLHPRPHGHHARSCRARADDQARAKSRRDPPLCAEQGIRHFFEVGRGICHQVLSEEAIVLPGQLILGADSHTTHFGWLGAFGAGIGRSEVAALWATGELWLRVPESMKIVLEGDTAARRHRQGLCLRVIGDLGADGGCTMSSSFTAAASQALSLESRMVLPNMMAEFGAKNAWMRRMKSTVAYWRSDWRRWRNLRAGNTGTWACPPTRTWACGLRKETVQRSGQDFSPFSAGDRGAGDHRGRVSLSRC
jgi:3-isopropylmalate/(R)-2-methylmalate dehydratase large subunit